jgi:hypothetical protein
MDLCTRKCVQRSQLKEDVAHSYPARSCFHRCSIKFLEALRFTADTLRFQTHEIKVQTAALQDQPQGSLLDKLHGLYEETYGRRPPVAAGG